MVVNLDDYGEVFVFVFSTDVNLFFVNEAKTLSD